MVLKKIILVLLFGASSAVAIAQDSKPVQKYKDYMPHCMAQKEAAEPDGVFDSSIDRGMAKALCQCQFEHFPSRLVMTKTEFINSAMTCRREQGKDFIAFTIKYLSRADKIKKLD